MFLNKNWKRLRADIKDALFIKLIAGGFKDKKIDPTDIIVTLRRVLGLGEVEETQSKARRARRGPVKQTAGTKSCPVRLLWKS